MTPEKTEAIKIITSWIDNAKTRQQQRDFFLVADFIHGDLEYIKSNESILKISNFLNSGDQDNEDLITIRKYLRL